MPFDIGPEDVFVPEVCPVLGIPLRSGKGRGGLNDASPTLDRVIGPLGYVPGNVVVISHRANRIKSDATVEELEAILRHARGA